MPNNFLGVDTKDFNEFTNRFKKLANSDDFLVTAITAVANNYLKDVMSRTPVKTGQLKEQWKKDNKDIRAKVIKKSDGYEVVLINTTVYASWVEKGHFAYNQYGGPWPVVNAKVPDSSGWVYGRFYVRNTENIWNNGKLDRSFQNRLTRWIKGTLDGKP